MKQIKGKKVFLILFCCKSNDYSFMKKLLYTLGLMLFACPLVAQQHYLIAAELTGFKDQTKFYLKDLTANADIDSAILVDGKFEMKGKIANVKSLWICTRTAGRFYYANLLIGPEKISVKGDLNDFPRHLSIRGSKNQDAYNTLNDQTKSLWQKRDSIVAIVMPYIVGTKKDSTNAIVKELGNKMTKIDSVIDQITISFIKTNLNSYAAVQELYWKRNKYSREEFEKIFNAVQPQFKQSIFGKRIINYLKVGEAIKKGDQFYNFIAADIKGKKYQLADYKGKYVLLDFTETYCGPCILAVADLKRLAAKYQAQLQIVTFYAEVNKKTMEEGLKRDQPTWPSIWDGKGTDSEITLKYGVTGYPSFILIDPQGKVVAKFSGYGKDDNGKGSLENQVDKILAQTK